jgi:hypothetical protein
MNNPRFISIILTIVVCISTYAQDRPLFHGPVVYLELGGACSLLSMNVEHVVFKLPRWYVNARVGYGYAVINGFERSGTPVGVNIFKFTGNHHPEIGAGISYIEGIERYRAGSDTRWNRGLYAYAALGYRFQRPQGGMFFKALWNPLFQLREYNPDPYFVIGKASPYWWALSAGYFFDRKKKKQD